MTDTEDHPDWFGAGTTPEQPRAVDTDAPPAADWFDDPTYLDPTPEDAPTAAAASGAEAPSAERGDDEGDPAGSVEQAAQPAQGSAGSGAAERAASGDADRRESTADSGTVVRDEQGRPVRQPAESRGQRETEQSGGIIAWLKRLLGLN
jgi:hypothetical protein